jgi:Spy/CpxP family protein refolding chaperone
MLKIACGVLVFFGLALSAAAVSAQDAPSGRWWNSPQVTKQLNLTSGEKQQLESAYRDSRRKLIQKKSRVEAEQFELENLMGQPKLTKRPSAPRTENWKKPVRTWPMKSSPLWWRSEK